jgi:hypothetical protein
MKTFNKVISGIVIGGTILSSSAIALADTKTSTTVKNILQGRSSIAGKMVRGREGIFEKNISKNNIENDLKALVTAGVITQNESDKILALSKSEDQARQAEMDKVKNMTDSERKAYFDSMKGKAPQMKGDIFTQAVSSSIITQEKADAAKAKLQETRDAEMKAKLTEGLSSLVKAGTITQEQSDKVLAYINTLEANKPASGTVPSEPKDSAAAKAETKKNPLSALVDNGTLTQAQLNAVAKVLPMGKGYGHGGPGFSGMNKPVDATTSATASASNAK